MARQLRAVLVGNGPSLNAHVRRGDFDRLRAVDTFGINLIDWLYPETTWRPSHWLFVEHMGRNVPPEEHWRRVVERHLMSGEMCLVEQRFRPAITKAMDGMGCGGEVLERVRWVWRASCEHSGPHTSSKAPTAWHLPELCEFGGSMSAALQLAFMMGYTDVAVVGCDLGLTLSGGDHFDPNYYSVCDFDIRLLDDSLRRAHSLARHHFVRAGRRIVNAGIGGELEVYERMPLERWLND